MSTVTGPFEFASYTEAVDGGDDPWTNPGNMLTSTSTIATCNALSGYPAYEESYRIQFYDWAGSGSVDTDAIIEDIELEYYNHYSGTTIYYPGMYWEVNNSFWRSVAMRQTPGITTINGDLAYWGVTNAEALAAIHATAAATGRNSFYVKAAQNRYDISMYRVRMTVTWSERPPSGGIMLGSFG